MYWILSEVSEFLETCLLLQTAPRLILLSLIFPPEHGNDGHVTKGCEALNEVMKLINMKIFWKRQ